MNDCAASDAITLYGVYSNYCHYYYRYKSLSHNC